MAENRGSGEVKTKKKTKEEFKRKKRDPWGGSAAVASSRVQAR